MDWEEVKCRGAGMGIRGAGMMVKLDGGRGWNRKGQERSQEERNTR